MLTGGADDFGPVLEAALPAELRADPAALLVALARQGTVEAPQELVVFALKATGGSDAHSNLVALAQACHAASSEKAMPLPVPAPVTIEAPDALATDEENMGAKAKEADEVNVVVRLEQGSLTISSGLEGELTQFLRCELADGLIAVKVLPTSITTKVTLQSAAVVDYMRQDSKFPHLLSVCQQQNSVLCRQPDEAAFDLEVVLVDPDPDRNDPGSTDLKIALAGLQLDVERLSFPALLALGLEFSESQTMIAENGVTYRFESDLGTKPPLVAKTEVLVVSRGLLGTFLHQDQPVFDITLAQISVAVVYLTGGVRLNVTTRCGSLQMRSTALCNTPHHCMVSTVGHNAGKAGDGTAESFRVEYETSWTACESRFHMSVSQHRIVYLNRFVTELRRYWNSGYLMHSMEANEKKKMEDALRRAAAAAAQLAHSVTTKDPKVTRLALDFQQATVVVPVHRLSENAAVLSFDRLQVENCQETFDLLAGSVGPHRGSLVNLVVHMENALIGFEGEPQLSHPILDQGIKASLTITQPVLDPTQVLSY